MSDYKTTNYFFSPAAGCRPAVLWRLLWSQFPARIPLSLRLKGPLTFISSSLFAPFNWYERLTRRNKIAAQKVEAPLFIIGHWRSGTTHLHNLLSKDPQFACTSTYQCMFPNSFLTNPILRPILRKAMPKTRPMDNMRLTLDAPQEDELALGNMMEGSFYNAWMWPKSMWKLYGEYVKFTGWSERRKQKWERIYHYLLQKTTLAGAGRRLLLKNPAHTARIPTLLKLYPDAKFIFIHRHPATIYRSTMHLYRTAQPSMSFQAFSEAERQEIVLKIYDDLMQTYLQDRDLIPSGQLIEIPFVELEADPLTELERIYKELNLNGWEDTKPKIEEYLKGIRNYKKNKHQEAEEDIALVYRKWRFAFNAFEYGREPAQ